MTTINTCLVAFLCNDYRTALGVLFSFALHRGYVLKNPVTLAERARVRAEKPAILTVAEAPALIENAEADFIPAFALGQVPGILFATRASPQDASRGFGVESGRFHAEGDQTFTVLGIFSRQGLHRGVVQGVYKMLTQE